MELILQTASAVAFYVFTFFMFEKLYTRKNIKKRYKVLIIAGAAAGMIIIGFLEIPILNFLFSICSMLLLNKLLYEPKGKSFIIYDIVLLIIMMAIEMISVSLLALTINKEINVILDNFRYSSAATVMNWIILFFCFRIFMFLISEKKITNIKTQEFVFFIVLISGEIFFLHFLNDIFVESKVKYELTIVLLIFLALDLYLAYLLQKISESYQTEKKLELVTQQALLQLNAYKELNEKYNSSRKIIHDVKKHVASLEGLINSNNADAADKYKGLLNAELNKLVPQFECDNPILTVIINNKLTVAEGMNIDFKTDIEFSVLDFISDLDITAIFSNLLDNAFEACGELTEDRRHIHLMVTRHNYFLLIYLENTYKSVEVDTNHIFKSTKMHHQGVGLSNVKGAVKKYGGNFKAHTEEGLFKTEILIPIPDTYHL
ncbi:MAG: sensor histidine kinase [Butyrivibrio sp.]